jgi:2-polyprenyl-3-methyl-5-hydroxy-6-metoxy-1,4-benzoquinol methylase
VRVRLRADNDLLNARVDATNSESTMTDRPDYTEYVTDQAFLTKYNAYQARYRSAARECDKVLINLVVDALQRRPSRTAPRLLDMGCSTGNFLLHLHRMLPELDATGADLAESSLEQCRRNPELAGVNFEKLDLFALPASGSFDVVVVNAVLYMMTDEQFEKALDSIHGALAVGGTVLAFDFFHGFDQHVSILEKSDSHPDGLPISFRPQSLVAGWMQKHGFEKPQYFPFTLPIDLPKSNEPGLPTYTVKTVEGVRLPFRGTLFQPWCHMMADKAT